MCYEAPLLLSPGVLVGEEISASIFRAGMLVMRCDFFKAFSSGFLIFQFLRLPFLIVD